MKSANVISGGCPQCGNLVMWSEGLHESPFVCGQCEEGLSDEDFLARHGFNFTKHKR